MSAIEAALWAAGGSIAGMLAGGLGVIRWSSRRANAKLAKTVRIGAATRRAQADGWAAQQLDAGRVQSEALAAALVRARRTR